MSKLVALQFAVSGEYLRALANNGNAVETSNDLCRIIEILWTLRTAGTQLDDAAALISTLTSQRDKLQEELLRTRADLSSLIQSLPPHPERSSA